MNKISLNIGTIKRAFNQLISIDFGSTKTVLFDIERGVFLEEPSVLVVDGALGSIRALAVGHQANAMVDRTTGRLEVVYPVQDGAIVDLDRAELLLKHLLQRVAFRNPFSYYEAVVALPPGSTEVERRALRDTVMGAGARQVHLVDKAVAAAIGSGLSVTSPFGSMVVDVGAGTTTAAIVNAGGTAHSAIVRVGGNRMDQAIITEIKKSYGVLIGEPTAERVKRTIGAAVMNGDDDDIEASVRGRSLSTGMPVEIMISRSDIVRALSEPLSMVCSTVFSALREAKPELVGDVMDAGIMLTGGASLLPHFDQYLSQMVGLPVSLGEEPARAVALGAARHWQGAPVDFDYVPL
jgi:rod shape-determining protein MreB and related proteins